MNTSIVSIEGGVGAGKSTLLEKIGSTGYVVLQEPIDLWSSFYGSNPLQLLYETPKRWSFAFQILALHSRVKSLQDCIQQNPTAAVIFIERSILADIKVFTTHSANMGNMTRMELELYYDLHETLSSLVPMPCCHIYLATNPITCNARTLFRGRQGEQAIVTNFHHDIYNLHEKWLRHESKIPVMVLEDNYDEVIPQMLDFINETINK